MLPAAVYASKQNSVARKPEADGSLVLGSPAGPVNIHDRVLRAMNVPGQNHRDPWFAAFFKDVLAGVL